MKRIAKETGIQMKIETKCLHEGYEPQNGESQRAADSPEYNV